MLGKRLKELRTLHGLSLRELARRTGLSATLLSQVERGVTEPSLTTLRKLSNIFGDSVAILFSDSSESGAWISRPGERTRLIGPRGGVTYERLTRGNGVMEVLRAVFEPGEFSDEGMLTHSSLECLYVISGELIAEVGEHRYLVKAGESISFDARAPHRYINGGDESAEILMSVTPPVP